jgi:hypothetical protein
MIQGYIDEVMIKEVSNLRPDRVAIIRNLPRHLIYRETVKMVSKRDRDGYVIDALVPDPEGTIEETLKEGLEFSRNGDGSIVFNTRRQHVADALKAVDAYIQGTLPRDVVVPQRVDYAAQRGNMLASPIPTTQIPAIDLPQIDRVAAEETSPPAKAVSPKPARELNDAAKAKRCAILAKARAAKAAKKASQ